MSATTHPATPAQFRTVLVSFLLRGCPLGQAIESRSAKSKSAIENYFLFQ
jgi:hypothetical protein